MKKEIKENQEEELEPYGEWEYRFSKIIEKGIDWKSQSIVHSGWIEELEKRIQKEREKWLERLGGAEGRNFQAGIKEGKKQFKNEILKELERIKGLNYLFAGGQITKEEIKQEIKEIIEKI